VSDATSSGLLRRAATTLRSRHRAHKPGAPTP